MVTKKNTTARELLLEYLKAQGLTASRTKVGINFRYDGWNFLLWRDADDPSFFRLTLPGIFDVTDDCYARALMACNTLNWNYKVIKASLYEYEEDGKQRASVWVCYERILDKAFSQDVDMVAGAVTALIAAAEQFQNLVERN